MKLLALSRFLSKPWDKNKLVVEVEEEEVVVSFHGRGTPRGRRGEPRGGDRGVVSRLEKDDRNE